MHTSRSSEGIIIGEMKVLELTHERANEDWIFWSKALGKRNFGTRNSNTASIRRFLKKKFKIISKERMIMILFQRLSTQRCQQKY